MAEDKFHFLIPSESIRLAEYEKRGRSLSYDRLDHARHGIKLRNQGLTVFNSESRKKDSQFISDLYVQIESPPKTSIKNYKGNIEKLGFELINYRPDKPSVGIARIKKRRWDSIGEKLTTYIESPDNRGKSYFSPIESLSVIPTASKVHIDTKALDSTKIPVVFNLYRSISSREKLPISQVIAKNLEGIATDIAQNSFSNGTASVSCSIDASMIQSFTEQFAAVRDVQIDEGAFIENAIDTQELPKQLKIESPISNSAICVIDSGIKDGGGVFNGIISETIVKLPRGAVNGHYIHGTFVASRCVFGDNIDACLGTNTLSPYCKVVDVPVFGVNAKGQRVETNQTHLLRVIEAVVIQLHKKVRVYNLSLGMQSSITDHRYSELAKLLDFLSKKYKVLFVVASGNINSLLGRFPGRHFSDPAARLSSPAESLLALTVGAISKHADTNSLSRQGELAPFSRIGPGPDRGLKPEVVAHGGNLIVQYDRSPRVSTYGISTDGKSLAVNVGTSFSAPLVSQYAQRLFDVYSENDPNLIKALLCHFSVGRELPPGTTNARLHCTGFGEPMVEPAIAAGDHNAAFIFEGNLDQENYQYIPFHIPKSLAPGNKSKLKIKVTVVYDPKVDEDNPVEYSQSRITASIEKPGTKKTSSVRLSNKSGYSVPWSPVIQFTKTFSRNYLAGEWELKLRLYTRGKLPFNYKQDFAVVIEVIDDKNNADVYNDVKEEFGKIYKNVKIKAAA